MRPDISEFSYGFALTREITNRYPLRSEGPPTFPSQVQEGRVGGHDVEIPGIPLFLQFKLSHRMVGRSASHAYEIGLPHYRFQLRALRYSSQHNLLLQLEGAGNQVFYAAPEFHTPTQLHSAYNQLTVEESTAFFSPVDIGDLPDRDTHYVAFRPGESWGWFFSDPIRVERSLLGDRIKRYAHKEPGKTLGELADEMIEIYSTSGRKPLDRALADLGSKNEMTALAYTSHLSRVLFDCELLLPSSLFLKELKSPKVGLKGGKARDEALAEVGQKIEAGIASLDRGEAIDAETLLDELEKRIDDREAAARS